MRCYYYPSFYKRFIMTSNIKYFILSALLLASLFACSVEPQKMNTQKLETKVGKEVVEIIQSPKTISIDQKTGNVGSSKLQELQSLLLNDKHYIFMATKLCVFIPEKTITLSSDKGVVKLTFGTNCNQILVESRGEKITLDYDPISKDLNQLINNIE